MTGVRTRHRLGAMASLCALTGLCAALASCSAGGPAATPSRHAASQAHATAGATPRTVASHANVPGRPGSQTATVLPPPTALIPFGGPAFAGEGTWRSAGRLVGGVPAIYETALIPPGGTQRAGIAWMNTKLLSARLYSGSKSPGGGPYRYTAPIQPAQAATLVAAFNGGFQMAAAHGGYYTEGRMIYPLVAGAASLVIYANGNVTVGAWGTDARMAPDVVAVRQNLVPLVADGQPTALAASSDWQAWGSTCGVSSCAASVPGIEHQWRSGLGITADGALVYAVGPALDPLQLAQLLVRAGVVRGMQLDINPSWPVFASYDPPTPRGLAAPSNGSKLLSTTEQGPWTFFESWWARDFITMSARRAG